MGREIYLPHCLSYGRYGVGLGEVEGEVLDAPEGEEDAEGDFYCEGDAGRYECWVYNGCQMSETGQGDI